MKIRTRIMITLLAAVFTLGSVRAQNNYDYSYSTPLIPLVSRVHYYPNLKLAYDNFWSYFIRTGDETASARRAVNDYVTEGGARLDSALHEIRELNAAEFDRIFKRYQLELK